MYTSKSSLAPSHRPVFSSPPFAPRHVHPQVTDILQATMSNQKTAPTGQNTTVANTNSTPTAPSIPTTFYHYPLTKVYTDAAGVTWYKHYLDSAADRLKWFTDRMMDLSTHPAELAYIHKRLSPPKPRDEMVDWGDGWRGGVWGKGRDDGIWAWTTKKPEGVDEEWKEIEGMVEGGGEGEGEKDT